MPKIKDDFTESDEYRRTLEKGAAEDEIMDYIFIIEKQIQQIYKLLEEKR